MATLIVRRTSPRDIKIRGLELLLDGRHADNLAYGDEVQIDVSPGSHEVKVTNSLYTKSASFTAEPNEIITFDAANVMPKGLGLSLAMFGIVPYKVELQAA